jgi:hypothetical protein
MAISNTSILIKRSSATTNPGTLKSGELAYSYVSNTLYFGTVGGNGTMNIGGQYYTSAIDTSTNNSTGGTLVKRDATGNASFNYVSANIIGTIVGNANSASYLYNPQNFSISGGDIAASAVVFDGQHPVALNASLSAVSGLSAGTYGSTTSIPVIGLSANGRVTSISTAAISTSFNISDGVNSNTINAGATFYHQASGGITTTVTGNTVTIGTNNTILRANTASAGQQTISTDLTVAGNLIVTGTQTIINTSTVSTNDSLIKLAANNYVADVVDIGFYGESNTGTSIAYHGLIREGSGGTNAGSFYLFKNLATDPTGNTVNYAGLSKATLYADLTGATGLPVATGISGLGTGVATFLASPTSTNLLAAVVSGNTGTGNLVFNNTPTFITPNLGVANAAQYNIGTLTYSASQAFSKLQTDSNSFSQVVLQNSNTGTQASVDFIVSNAISADNHYYGDFGMNGPNFVGDGAFGAANSVYLYADGTDIAIGTTSSNSIHFVVNNGTTDALKIDANGFISTSQTLTVPYGGTGGAYFAPGSLLLGNATGAFSSLANSSFTATGTGAANNTVTSVTVDAYGRTTALTYSAITGLTVGQGGTGVASFTTNGITYGNSSGPMQVTAAAGTTDQTWSNQILTVTNAGVPVWSSALDGGNF